MGAVDVERRVVGEETPDVVGGGHAVGGGGGERVAGDREGSIAAQYFAYLAYSIWVNLLLKMKLNIIDYINYNEQRT